MSPTEPARVQEAFSLADCDWILEYPKEQEQRHLLLEVVAKEIDEFREAFNQRFRRLPDPFDLINDNTEKATAFFEIFGGPPLSVDIRILIWRLIEGAEIREIDVRYERKRPFSARFVIGNRGSVDEIYETNHPWDFTVLRHLGMLTVDGKLVLEGYYASKFLGP